MNVPYALENFFSSIELDIYQLYLINSSIYIFHKCILCLPELSCIEKNELNSPYSTAFLNISYNSQFSFSEFEYNATWCTDTHNYDMLTKDYVLEHYNMPFFSLFHCKVLNLCPNVKTVTSVFLFITSLIHFYLIFNIAE